jgi:hypothetical protein
MLDIAEMVKFVLSCCALHEICLLNDDEFDEYIQKGLRGNEEVNDFHDFSSCTILNCLNYQD